MGLGQVSGRRRSALHCGSSSEDSVGNPRARMPGVSRDQPTITTPAAPQLRALMLMSSPHDAWTRAGPVQTYTSSGFRSSKRTDRGARAQTVRRQRSKMETWPDAHAIPGRRAASTLQYGNVKAK